MYKKGRVNSNSRIISTDEDPSLRIESSAIINLRGVSTKLNKYNCFLFNCLSNFVQIHYYYILIARVWKKYWKRHLFAHMIIVVVIVSYFTEVLLSCFRARESGTNEIPYIVKNCTFFNSDCLDCQTKELSSHAYLPHTPVCYYN